MADIQDTDLFLVNRNNSTGTLAASELMAEIQDDDLMLVNRAGVTHKVTGADVKDSLGPKGTVDRPSIVSPADNAGEMVQAISDEIVDYTSEQITYSSRVSITGPDAYYPPDRGPEKIFDGDPNTLCAVESSSASEEVEIVFNARGLNLDTNNENMVARSAGGWTFKVTGVDGTAERAISSDPEGTPLPALGILEEIRVKGNGANWMYLKAGGAFLVDGADNYVLTLASDKDLTVFQPLDDVQQDSGYTPQTSVITNVDAQGLPAEKWSDKLTQMGAETGVIDSPANAFDGRTNTRAYNGNSSQNPNSMTWSLYPGATIATDYIWVQCGDGGAQADTLTFVINGVATSPSESHLQAGQSQGWYTWWKLPVSSGQFHTIVITNAKTAGVILRGFSLDPTPYTESTQIIPGAIIDNEGIGLKTVLTLTNDTDLVNLREGDVVTGALYDGGTGPFVGFRTIEGMSKVYQEGTDYTIKSGDNFAGASNYVLCFDTQQLGANWTFTCTKTAGAENFQMYTADTDIQGWREVFNNITSPITIAHDNTNYSRYIAIYATGTGYMEYELTGTGRSQTSATIEDIDSASLKITVSGGTWNNGDTVTGPDITPATGTVGSTNSATKTITLSVSDESGTKRWIVGQGKFVKGEETPSQDAAPEADGLAIESSAFASTPPGSLGHTDSDWQITLKTDTAYANPVAESFDDETNLITWEPGNLEEETEYRCRVKHRAGAIESEWSEDSTFKTAESNTLVTKPGPIFATGGTAGNPGGLKTNVVKMVSVAWGDAAYAFGVDGKLYAGDLSYSAMTERLAPAEEWSGFGVTYRGQGIGIRKETGKVDLFNAATGAYFAQDVEIATGVRCNRFSFDTADKLMYVEGDDGNVYVANSATAPTAFRKLIDGYNVIDFAIGMASYSKITYIDSNNDLWQADLSDVGNPGTGVSNLVQLHAGTKFKSVVSGFAGTAAAITTDGGLKLINAGTGAGNATLENLPAGFDLKEVAFGYYSIWGLSTDGRIICGGSVSTAGPINGTPDADNWGELILPHPCRGFGTTKYCGSGYDYAFIVDEDA